MKKLTAILILICVVTVTAYEDYEFKVLTRAGKVILNKSDQKLFAGHKLLKKDGITLVDEKSRISILHNSGKVIELKSPGFFKINELSNAVEKNPGINEQFMKFVLDKIGNNEDLFKKEQITSNMTISGMVVRSLFVDPSDNIYLKTPKNTNILEPEIKFCWYKTPSINNYNLVIMNRFNEQMYSNSTSDTMMTLNIKDIGLTEGEFYIWHVQSLTGLSGNSYFYWVPQEEQQEILSGLEEIESNFSDYSEAFQMFLRAGYLDKMNLAEQALASYKKAYELEPDNQDYKKYLVAYLVKIGLANETRQYLDD